MNLPFGNAKGNQGGKIENSIWSLGSPSPNALNPDRKTQIPIEIKWRKDGKEGPKLSAYGEGDKLFVESDPTSRYFGNSLLSLYFEAAP